MPRAGVLRQTVELLVLLCLCVLVGTHVFGGSVCGSDRLDGSHAVGAASRDRVHQLRLSVRRRDRRGGTDRAGRCARIAASAGWTARRRWSAAATACWCRSFCTISAGPSAGKWLCFTFPGEPSQAYVKRVVGLPGESIRIIGGDIFVDGKIVRKSLPEIRAMRHAWFTTADSSLEMPRAFRAGSLACGSRDASLESEWMIEGRPVRPQAASTRRAAAYGLARLQALGSGQRAVRAGP